MARDRAPQYIGAGLAVAALLVLVVVDVLIPGGTVALAPLFALAPLIACAVLPAAPTAVFAVASIVLAVASGGWDDNWNSAQQSVRVVDVVIVSAAAVLISAVRVRREQRHARVVVIAEAAQRAILPKLPRRAGQVTVAARYESAAKDAVVGGDLYDCYHSSAYVRFLVGDVRGKGIAGVEQAARVIRAFRQSAAIQPNLSAVAREMSAYLEPFFDDEEFVTALLVDVSEPGTLSLVSCGHPAPLLVGRDGQGTFFEPPVGLPLGLGGTYAAGNAPWSPGDRLLVYTDGLSEARDEHGEFLPVEALAPLVCEGTVDEALDAVLGAVRRHVARGNLTDDLAVILLEHVAVREESDEGAPQPTSTGLDVPEERQGRPAAADPPGEVRTPGVRS